MIWLGRMLVKVLGKKEGKVLVEGPEGQIALVRARQVSDKGEVNSSVFLRDNFFHKTTTPMHKLDLSTLENQLAQVSRQLRKLSARTGDSEFADLADEAALQLEAVMEEIKARSSQKRVPPEQWNQGI